VATRDDQAAFAGLARASAAGTFTISQLPPGEYLVVALTSRPIGDWEDPAFLESIVPGATRTSIAEGERKSVSVTTFSAKAR